MNLKGLCKDCFYLQQEWCTVLGTNGKMTMVLDKWCLINQVFKREDGYCDFWEENDGKR